MIEDYKKDLSHRLKIIRGHLDKIIQMVEKEEYCFDILQQTQAVEGSLRKIDELLLEHHLRTCVKDAINKGEIDDKVREIIEAFRKK